MSIDTSGAVKSARSNRIAAAVERWIFELRHREGQLFLVLSLFIGAVVGAIVALFILLTEDLGKYMYPTGGIGFRRLLVPIAGSLVTGFLLSRYFPEARGSGIPQTKVALFLYGGRIRFKTVLGRFFCSAASLGCGISLGREGPTVQVGAGLSSVLGRRLGFGPDKIRALIPVGSAAAIAAAFNTPIAGCLFALEEIMGDLHAPLLGSVVLSSATSWMALHLILGDEPLFHVPVYQVSHPGEFIAYAVLGLAGGFVSVAFVKLTLYWRAKFRLLPRWTVPFQPVAGGIVCGIIGLFAPQILGAGYMFVGQVLNGNFVFTTVALLVGLKLIATAACYASGNTGGIFGPSVFMGAMLGASFGTVVHHWFPLHTATPGTYALVGMGATFAGIIRTPLTSVFMIFEMTRDYSIIVPLMIANLTSFFISYRLQRRPVYDALNEQDGIHLPEPESERARHQSKRVALFMRKPPPFFAPETVLAELPPSPNGGLYLIGKGDDLLGAVRFNDIADLPLDRRKPVSEIMLRNSTESALPDAEEIPHVHGDHPIELALERMSDNKISMLPVLDRANIRHVRGVVFAEDLLRSYGFPFTDHEITPKSH